MPRQQQHPMAADQNIKNKISKKPRFICFSSFTGCFGSHHKKTTHEKLVKYETRASSGRSRARTVPISHPTPVVGSSSQEIHVVDQGVEDQLIAALAPQIQSQQLGNKKVHDMIKKNKKMCPKSNSSTQEEARSKPAIKLLQSSVSLPPPPRTKREKPTSGGEGSGEKPGEGGQSIEPDQLDPMVGALVLMVTLIVLLSWGKICAIICTALWFYVIPRLGASNDNLNVNKLKNRLESIDVDSWKNKRRVVFEGFLERF